MGGRGLLVRHPSDLARGKRALTRFVRPQAHVFSRCTACCVFPWLSRCISLAICNSGRLHPSVRGERKVDLRESRPLASGR